MGGDDDDAPVDLGFELVEDEAEVPKEDRGAMMKRHRQEEQALRKELKDKIFAIHKSKQQERKEAEDARDAALEEMAKRHAEELGGGADATADGIAALSMGGGGGGSSGGGGGGGSKGGKKKSKGQKRDEKEREREQRMADTRAGAGPSQRDEELKSLAAQLAPLGLRVHEIPADGHCLYRSLTQQLQAQGQGYADEYLECRKELAGYMRAHPGDFAPFLDEGVDLASHCATVETSAEWGGQLEITAMSHARKRAICVWSAGSPPLLTGEEYEANGPRLQLAYHLHYYGLGAHYNAVVPIE